jgi:hypothetical protein
MLLPIENKLVDNNQCASLICLIKALSTAISVSSIIFIGVSCLLIKIHIYQCVYVTKYQISTADSYYIQMSP